MKTYLLSALILCAIIGVLHADYDHDHDDEDVHCYVCDLIDNSCSQFDNVDVIDEVHCDGKCYVGTLTRGCATDTTVCDQDSYQCCDGDLCNNAVTRAPRIILHISAAIMALVICL